MILAGAVILGLAAGLVRAWIGSRTYQVLALRFAWLVPFAFLPQWIAFYQSKMGRGFPNRWAPAVLVSSQSVLATFAWFNRKKPGFWLLASGLFLNLAAIVRNGGLMPISPEAVRKLYPDAPETSWQIGKRLGNGKDIVLPPAETHLQVLSDRFLFPDWLHYKVAFSVGDVLIAFGAFWLLWTLGGPRNRTKHS